MTPSRNPYVNPNALLNDSLRIVTAVRERLPEIIAVANRMTDVDDLVQFQHQVNHINGYLALLVEASEIIIRVTKTGFDLITAEDPAAARQVLELGSAALRPEDFFATAEQHALLQQEVREIGDYLNWLVNEIRDNYATKDMLSNVRQELLDALNTLAQTVGQISSKVIELDGLFDRVDTLNEQMIGFGTEIGLIRDDYELLSTAYLSLRTTVEEFGDYMRTTSAQMTELSSRITNTETGLIAESKAREELRTEVIRQGNYIQATSQKAVDLESRLLLNEGQLEVLSTAQNDLTTLVQQRDNEVTALTQQVAQLEVNYNDMESGLELQGQATEELRAALQMTDDSVQILSEQTTKLSANLKSYDNLLPNSDWTSGISGWSITQRGPGWELPDLFRDVDPNNYLPAGTHTLGVRVSPAPSGSICIESSPIPVEVGDRFIAQARLAGVNLTAVAEVVFYNVAGLVVPFDGYIGQSNPGDGGMTLDDWPQHWAEFSVPAGAASMAMRVWGQNATGAPAEVHILRPMVERAVEGQVGPSPWSPNPLGLPGALAEAEARLSAEILATRDQVTSISQDVVDLTSAIDGLADADALELLQTQVTQMGDDITAFSQYMMQLQARMPAGDGKLATSAQVASEESARVSGDNALGSRIGVVEGRMPTGTDKLVNEARVVTAETAAANATSAVANQVTNLSAKVESIGRAGDNAIFDGDFEMYADGQVLVNQGSATGTAVVTTAAAYSGTKSVVLTRGSSQTGNLDMGMPRDGSVIPCNGVRTWYIEAMVRRAPSSTVSTGNTRLNLYARVTKTDGSFEWPLFASITIGEVGTNWTKISGRATTSSNAVGIIGLVVLVGADSQNGAAFMVDSFVMRDVTEVQIVDARVTNVENASVTRDNALSSRIGVVEASYGQSAPNLLINPTFKDGLAGWAAWSGAFVQSEAAFGPYAVIPATGGAAIDQDIQGPFVAGRYWLSADVYRNSLTGNARIEIAAINSSGQQMYANTWHANDASYIGNFKRLSVWLDLGSGVATLRVRLIAEGTDNATSFRRVKLEKSNTATAYTDERTLNATATSASVTNLQSAMAAADRALAQDITTAQATANGAQSTATTALSTANNAASVASSVQTAAGNAQSTATTALNTANNAASSVATVATRVGGSGNLVPNSDLSQGLSAWNLAWNPGNWAGPSLNLAGDGWRPPNVRTIGIIKSGPIGSGKYGVVYSNKIPVEGGKWYIFSARTANHRSRVRLAMKFTSPTNSNISEPGTDWLSPQNGGRDLNNWGAPYMRVQAPAGATDVEVGFWADGSGEADGYVWMCRPMLEEAGPSQTLPSPYAIGPVGDQVVSATSALTTSIDSVSGRLSAKQTVALDVNGNISGTVSENDGVRSSFRVLTDVFQIVAPNGGQRTEYSGGNWRCYDSNGVLRVRMGVW